MLNRKGSKTKPYRTPRDKSMKSTKKNIYFNSMFPICKVIVHNFKGFV